MLFNRDVKRISDLVADPVLRAFAGGICVFGGRKGVPPASRSARNLSVRVSVRVMSPSFLKNENYPDKRRIVRHIGDLSRTVVFCACAKQDGSGYTTTMSQSFLQALLEQLDGS